MIEFIRGLLYIKLNKPFSQPFLRGYLLQFPNSPGNPSLDLFQFANLFLMQRNPSLAARLQMQYCKCWVQRNNQFPQFLGYNATQYTVDHLKWRSLHKPLLNFNGFMSAHSSSLSASPWMPALSQSTLTSSASLESCTNLRVLLQITDTLIKQDKGNTTGQSMTCCTSLLGIFFTTFLFIHLEMVYNTTHSMIFPGMKVRLTCAFFTGIIFVSFWRWL